MRRFRSAIVLASLVAVAFALVPSGAANSTRGRPLSNAAMDEALVEFNVDDRSSIEEMLALGVDLAEYRRDEGDGTFTVAAFVTPAEQAFLEGLGFRSGRTVEDRSTWEARRQERADAMAKEEASHEIAEEGLKADVSGITPFLSTSSASQSAAADGESGLSQSTAAADGESGPGEEAPPGAITIMRADYFVHRSGRFLSVEAKATDGSNQVLSASWKEEGGSYGTATTMSDYVDINYQYDRILVRVGAAGSTTPVPQMVRVASSTGAFAEDHVTTWPGPGLPPYADAYLSDFTDYYMDPVQVYDRINSLAVEFPNISEIVDLPYKTEGYQRKSFAVMDGTTAPNGSAPVAAKAVLLIAKEYGQDGGNDVQAEFISPTPPQPNTTVSVTGSRITVNLGLGATASQVVSAINAFPAASALVTAHTYAGDAGLGVVQPRALVNLSDYLDPRNEVADEDMGSFTPQVLRIGSHRDGSKVGVFIYCQQHAREWVTPITCVETAERLLRNYAIDPGTRQLVDNLDIFILPSVNPDGGMYSLHDFGSQRKNMTRHCPLTSASGMPASRNQWGVDLNRNNTVGTYFDGYSGASSTCTGETYAGPAEASEPEIRNEHWVVETFKNIKFSNNIHSYGGYFMWAPGAYISTGRVTLPYPNIGVEKYFFDGAEKILGRIAEFRGTVILPSRTGPVADVLYSAAGNSADEQWYRRNIIAYSFETGADLFQNTQNGTSQSAVGFFPRYETEGWHESMEFAAGNYGLLETALEYANDTEDPIARMKPNGAVGRAPFDATFSYVNEPAVIHYTTDGSTPTTSSPSWNARGPRQPGEWLHFEEDTTVKWIAVDIRGNVSDVQSATFVIDTVAPSTTVALSPEPINGSYIAPTITLAGADEGGAGVDFSEYNLDNGGWTRYEGPFSVTAGGQHALEYRSTDLAGNTEEVKSLTFSVTACTILGTDANDKLTGTNGADVICSLGGNDTVSANGGNDIVVSGTGADTVNGGHGNDIVFGVAGADDLQGIHGDDQLRGGAGFDRLNGGQGTDRCTVDEDGGTRKDCETT